MSVAERLTERTAVLVDALERGVDSLTIDEFAEATRAVGDAVRLVDSIGIALMGEISRRVRLDAEFRRRMLGGDAGGRFASELGRDLTRISDDQLADWDRVAAAVAPRTSLQGELLPAKHEPLAEAVAEGSITARAAAVIARGIDRAALTADPETCTEAERVLVGFADSLTTRELARAARAVLDRVDPDGAEPREDALRHMSRLTIRQMPDGLTRFTADLHPEAAAYLRTALDARTAPRRLPYFVDPHGETATTVDPRDPLTEDLRSLAERRADAVADIARQALGNDPGRLAGTAVTVLVTVPLENLRSRTGAAQIAGCDEPISAATARRMAANAEIIPVVLGADSEPLDLGRSARLFSEAQRRALSVCDGGCIWPGCDAPPSWCEVAHLTAWIENGVTDIENGALMCAAHHRRFDRDGWALRREHGVPYLIPPPSLDPRRTPRRAGRTPVVLAA